MRTFIVSYAGQDLFPVQIRMPLFTLGQRQF